VPSSSGIIIFANTSAKFAYLPISPGHHFTALIEGVLIINSSVFLSKVAVVYKDATSDPWPISVWA